MSILAQFVLAAFAIGALPLAAQEVAYLNLLGVEPRIQLRIPASPPPVCTDGVCTSGGFGGTSIGCGAGSRDDPKAFKITLVSLDRFSYTPGDRAEMEIKIENAGGVAMEIPWSPHLADLQPDDETLPFSYSNLYINLLLRNSDGQDEAPVIAQLYGNPEHSGTLITLQPGEWVRLRLETTLNVPAEKLKDGNGWTANVRYGLRSEKFVPDVKYGGYSTDIANQYPRQLSGVSLALEIRK